LGFLFALIALNEIHTLITQTKKWRVLTSSLAVAATILSHPAAIWFLGYSILFLLFYLRPKLGNLIRVLYANVIAFVLTAPWWLTVLLRFGISPFLSISGNATSSGSSLISLLIFQFTNESFLKIWAVTGLIGLLISIRDRKIFLPIWFLVAILIQGRGWQAFAEVPFAMLAGIGLQEILQLLATKDSQVNDALFNLRGLEPKLCLGYVVIISIASAFIGAPKDRISQSQVDAMSWVASHTPAGSQFAVITGDPAGSDSIINEWFPALTERISLTTAQGYEWKGKEFAQRIENQNVLQACSTRDENCLQQWAQTKGNDMQYVYILASLPLSDSLSSSSHFQKIFSSTDVQIFERR
jgi:hypothetical protein